MYEYTNTIDLSMEKLSRHSNEMVLLRQYMYVLQVWMYSVECIKCN